MTILSVSGTRFFYCLILANVHIKTSVHKYFVNNPSYTSLMLTDNEYLNMYLSKINKILHTCEFCFQINILLLKF